MASTSPVAPGITVEAVHNEGFATFWPDSVVNSAVQPPIQGVQNNDVVHTWMAGVEEDALAAGELVMVIIVFLTCWRASMCTLCRRLRASADL